MKAIILISEASLPLAKTLQRELPDHYKESCRIPLFIPKTNAKAVFPSHPAIGS